MSSNELLRRFEEKLMMNNEHLNQREIGDIVTMDFRTVDLFKEAGIDFCCGGKNTLEETCKAQGIAVDQFAEQLLTLMESPNPSGVDYNEWELDFLCDFILNTHHAYVKKTMPQLLEYTAKIALVHGDHHPELLEIARIFDEINKELTVHLQKEEELLFPVIKQAVANPTKEFRLVIKNEIARMGAEHEFAGGAMDQIREISQKYALPADACTSYQMCFQLLSQFEDDLHIHVHLENNILFKKALQL